MGEDASCSPSWVQFAIYCCSIFIEDTKSDLWVRASATIKDNPILASQADRVSRMRFLDIRYLVPTFRDQIAVLRKRDISRSSRHKRIDKKCSRLIIIPIRPR